MAGFMQVSGRDIRDKTITNDDIADLAAISISKIEGLQTALDNLASPSQVENQRPAGSAIKFWTGTQAQYDAIVTKDSNTVYFVSAT